MNILNLGLTAKQKKELIGDVPTLKGALIFIAGT